MTNSPSNEADLAYHRNWYRKNQPEIRDRRRKKERTPEYRQEKARYYRANKFKKRLYDIEYRYGLKPTEYLAMLERQGHACAICREGFGDRQPRVDHDHATGRVRGLLCNSCNSLLGYARESRVRLAAAAAYLEEKVAESHGLVRSCYGIPTIAPEGVQPDSIGSGSPAVPVEPGP